jgi:hypothetical protein
MKWLRNLGVATLALSMVSPATAATCAMPITEIQSNLDDPSPAHTTSIHVDRQIASSLFFDVPLHVNTDGTRRSYSVKDPWGEKNALNNLCNAMHGECRDLSSKAKRLRRMALVQAAAQANWPAGQLAATRLSANVIVMRQGKPCPLINGEYLVSATALQATHIKDRCNLSNYVDALKVPALVIPGGNSVLTRNGVKVGDLVVAYTPGATTPVYGVVGDTGDADKLGEPSIAMNKSLLNKTADPQNYTEIKHGWDVKKAYIVVFPRSRNTQTPYLTIDSTANAGKIAFSHWGGAARLEACIASPTT